MPFYGFVARESISEGFIAFWLFVFVKMESFVKIQARALCKDFSQTITDLPLICYQPERESHDWQAQEISALFL